MEAPGGLYEILEWLKALGSAPFSGGGSSLKAAGPLVFFAVVLFLALRFLFFALRPKPGVPTTRHGMGVEQIRATLACSEEQARTLLKMYQGDTAKAIQEVKTGKATLPGASPLMTAIYGGDVKSFGALPEGAFGLLTHDGRELTLGAEEPSLLVLGVVDQEQRPDIDGYGRADRGRTYGQLFWMVGGTWQRFLLDASRLDYTVLGEKKENSGIRNFRLLVGSLREALPNLTIDTSVEALEGLRAPLYRKLADFDAQAAQRLAAHRGES